MKGKITDSLKLLLTKRTSEVSYWKLNEMSGSNECLRQKHQFLNFWGKTMWGSYGKRGKSKREGRVSNRWNHMRSVIMKGKTTDSLKPSFAKRTSEVGYWKLNEMPGSSECLRQNHQFLNFWGKRIWGNYCKRAKSKWERRLSNHWNHMRKRGINVNSWESWILNFET